jgi:hypothetical protein
MAATLLKKPIRLIGPVTDPEYMREHASAFDSPWVTVVGELGGRQKLSAIRQSDCMLYSCSRDYVEAGGAYFTDPLRSGIPVAAQVWRNGTAAEAAIDSDSGSVSVIDAPLSDHEAAAALADAVRASIILDRVQVQKRGLEKFDPVRHFRDLACV